MSKGRNAAAWFYSQSFNGGTREAAAPTAITCKHDSGSMYGCVPLCDRPAAWKIDYHNGTYVLVTYACDKHRVVTEARVYPGHDKTTKLEGL